MILTTLAVILLDIYLSKISNTIIHIDSDTSVRHDNRRVFKPTAWYRVRGAPQFRSNGKLPQVQRPPKIYQEVQKPKGSFRKTKTHRCGSWS